MKINILSQNCGLYLMLQITIITNHTVEYTQMINRCYMNRFMFLNIKEKMYT